MLHIFLLFFSFACNRCFYIPAIAMQPDLIFWNVQYKFSSSWWWRRCSHTCERLIWVFWLNRCSQLCEYLKLYYFTWPTELLRWEDGRKAQTVAWGSSQRAMSAMTRRSSDWRCYADVTRATTKRTKSVERLNWVQTEHDMTTGHRLQAAGTTHCPTARDSQCHPRWLSMTCSVMTTVENSRATGPRRHLHTRDTAWLCVVQGYSLYTVSQKNIPDIFNCILKTN